MIQWSLKFSVFCTLVLTVVRGEERECGQHELGKCARSLQVLSETSDLKFVSSKEELDKICPDLFNGIRCIKSYTRRCMDVDERNHFSRLYKGTGEAVEALCQEGEYRSRFLEYAPCLTELKPQYERCAAAYQSDVTAINGNATQGQANDKLRTVCCSFQQYMACSVRVVQAHCGVESANFTKGFLHRMADALIKVHCRDYPEDGQECLTFGNHGYKVNSNWLQVFIPTVLLIASCLSLSVA